MDLMRPGSPMAVKLEQDQDRERARQLCPKGFVGREGYGNGRNCRWCGRDLEDHVPVAQ